MAPTLVLFNMSKRTPPAIKDLIVELSKKRKICIRDRSNAPTSLGAPTRKFYKSIGKQEVLKIRGMILGR